MSTDEKLLLAVKEASSKALSREIVQLERKLKRALAQRDEWKYRATHYKEKLLERVK